MFTHSIIGLQSNGIFNIFEGSKEHNLSSNDILPLNNNGGSTQTHCLTQNSYALDKGSNPKNLLYDQRGKGFLRDNTLKYVGACGFVPYTLIVNGGTGDGKYLKDATIEISAEILIGKYFKNWSTNDGGSFIDENSTITKYNMPDNDSTVTANFEKNIVVITTNVHNNTISINEGESTEIYLKLSKQPLSDVTITSTRDSGDDDITISKGASLTFTTNNWNAYQTVEITAAEDNNDIDNGSATILCTLTNVDGSNENNTTTNITVNEIDNDFKLKVISSGNGNVTPTSEIFVTTPSYSITASPHLGSTFERWRVTSGSATLTNQFSSNTEITSGTGSVTVTAYFPIGANTVIFTSRDNGSIAGITPQPLAYGASTSLVIPLPDEWYQFKNWTGDYTGNDKALVIHNVIEHKEIFANFELIDTDGDGISDKEELENGYNLAISTKVYYVNDAIGDDNNLGSEQLPKKTINAALSLAKQNIDREYVVKVAAGAYSGEGNTALDFEGYPIQLTSIDGPQSTIIDCNGTDQAFILDNATPTDMTGTMISGFTIIDGFRAVAASSGFVINNANGLIVKNCIFNSWTGGAGAVVDCDNSSVIFESCTFSDNTNIGTYHGGVFNIVSSKVTIESSIFTGNNSTSYGGIIYVKDSRSDSVNNGLIIKNSTINGNTAKNFGGAIYSTNSDLIFENCEFNENANIIRNDNGGAVYLLNSTLSADNCKFKSNISTKSGGALYIKTSTANFNECIFEENQNSEVNDDGGAIYAITATISITNSTFLKNETADNGGAIAGSALDLTVSNCEFTENFNATTTTDNGGAIYLVGVSRLRCSDSSFTNNVADYSGGAIYLDASGGTLTSSLFDGVDFDAIIERCTFQENKATLAYGGAIRNLDQMLILDSTFNGNSSETRGGAIYNSGTILDIVNCTISGNSTSISTSESVESYGGGIYTTKSMNMYNSSIFGNSTKTQGGGIFRSSNIGDVNIHSSIVAGNTIAGPVSDDISGTAIDLFNYSIIGAAGNALFTNFTGSHTQNMTGHIDPVLVANGGPTKTHALLNSSFAISKGSNYLNLQYDQRGEGFPRSFGVIDVGACAYKYLLPEIRLLKPTGEMNFSNEEFTIQWSDASSENSTTVSLYYDTDNRNFDGTLIIGNIPGTPDGIDDSYIWDTSAMPAGSYFIYAVLNDGVNPPVHSYSSTPLIINHNGGADNDGMLDEWEQQIIDANLNDNINSIEDVHPEDDFDGDGISNIDEFRYGLDPIKDDRGSPEYLWKYEYDLKRLININMLDHSINYEYDKTNNIIKVNTQ